MALSSSRPWIRRTALALAIGSFWLAGFGRSEAEEGGAGGAIPADLLKAFPRDTIAIYRIRFAELLSSPALKKIDVAGFLKAQDKTEGMAFPVEQLSDFLFGEPAEGMPTILARLATPVIEADFIARMEGEARPAPVEGRTTYHVKDSEMAFLSPTVIVIGEHPEDLGKSLAALDGKGEKCELAGELAKIDAPFAIAWKDYPVPSDSEGLKGVRIPRARLTVMARETLVLSAEIEMEKPEEAAALAEWIRAQVAEAKTQACQQLKALLDLPVPPAIAGLDNLKVSVDGKAVRLQAEVSTADLDLAKKAVDRMLQHPAGAERNRASHEMKRLIAALGNADAKVREETTTRLGRLGRRARPAVGALAKVAVDDLDEEVRWGALWALGSIEEGASTVPPEVLNALERGLSDTAASRAVRDHAAMALGRIGPAAKGSVPALLKAMSDADQNVRSSAVRALGQIGPAAAEAIPTLERCLLDSKDFSLRCGAVEAIGRMGPAGEPAALALGKALADPDANARRSAAELLLRMGPTARMAVPMLAQALNDPDLGVRMSVLEALQRLGPAARAAVPSLVQALDDKNADFRSRAVTTLGKIGRTEGGAAEGVVPVLLQALADGETSQAAAAALGALAGETPGARAEIVGELVILLDNRDGQVRSCAATALGCLKVKASEQKGVAFVALVRALGDERPGVRIAAARALGSGIGPSEAAAAGLLERLATKHPEGEIGRAVRETLERLRGREEKPSAPPSSPR